MRLTPSIARPPRLFDQERHGIGLVEQVQAALGVTGARVVGIEIDAAPRQHAIDVGDHRGDPAHVEILTPRPVRAHQQIVDISFDGVRPMARVSTC